MRQALTIAARDVRSTFGSAFGFGLTAGFLALAGVLLVFALRGGEARLDGWFAPLFVVMGALAPLLTMRSFSEEERGGSLELLLTSPVRPATLVAGKLAGVVAVFAVLVVGTLACPLLVGSMGSPDWGPVVTGYIGFLLVGIAFLAVGMAASATTASQLVAAAAAAGLLLGLWFAGGLAAGLGGSPRVVLEYLSPSTHVTGFLRGTVALTDVAYFASITVLGVAATASIVRARR